MKSRVPSFTGRACLKGDLREIWEPHRCPERQQDTWAKMPFRTVTPGPRQDHQHGRQGSYILCHVGSGALGHPSVSVTGWKERWQLVILTNLVTLYGRNCCSVIKLCPTLCNSMTVAHQDPLSFTIFRSLLNSCPLIQWCHLTISSSVAPISSCLQSFPASGSFKWVGCSHQVATVLELQLQHPSFKWIFRVGFL